MAFQRALREAERGVLVAGPGDVTLQDLAFLVDRAPQADHLAIKVGFAVLRVTYISSRCQRHCRKPRMRETHFRRMSPVHSGPNRFHHIRTVSRKISTPHSNSRPSTFLRLSGYFTYIITTRRITSGRGVEVAEWAGGVAFARHDQQAKPLILTSGAFGLTVPGLASALSGPRSQGARTPAARLGQ